jgi:hypothetical protein
MAAAMSRWTLPWYSSRATGGNASTHATRALQRPSQMTVPIRRASHSHRKSTQASDPNGSNARAMGGG